MKTNSKTIQWLSIGHFMTDVYSGLLNPIMPFITAKLGITLGFATIIIGISHIFSSLLQPLFGFFADKTLKRTFIFWGLILTAIFIPLTTVATNAYLLILFMVLGSIGSSFYHPQALGFVVRFSTSSAGKDMGLFMSLGSFGFSFGPIIAALILQKFGTEGIAYTSIVGIILALSMFFYVPQISKIDKKPEQYKFFHIIKEIFNNKIFNYLLIISIMKVLVTSSCIILLPFLWKSMDKTPFYIGFALFLFIFAGSLGTLFSRKFENLIGTKKLMYLSMNITFPLMLLFALTYKTHHNIATFIFIVTGFTSSLAQPITMIMAQKILPQYKSIIAGFINGVSWGIIAILLSFLGFTCEKIGIPLVLAILSLAPALSSYLVKYLDINYEN